jgi:hypothetical protein
MYVHAFRPTWGSMLAIFNFSLANLIYGIRAEGQDWVGPCTTEFMDTSRDSWPIRSDVGFMNDFPAEVSFKLLKDGAVDRTLMATGLDEQIASWRAEGYPCTSDAYIMRYWPAKKDMAELLGITVALQEQKFSRFQNFMELHLGRGDLWGRLICQFHGFSEPDSEMPNLPTKSEFLNNRHYFVTGDHSIVFGAKLP